MDLLSDPDRDPGFTAFDGAMLGSATTALIATITHYTVGDPVVGAWGAVIVAGVGGAIMERLRRWEEDQRSTEE